MDLLISLLIVLLYPWLMFKVAVILTGRAQQFSLRSLLIAMAVASVFIAILVQMGATGLFFLTETLIAGVAGVIVGIRLWQRR